MYGGSSGGRFETYSAALLPGHGTNGDRVDMRAVFLYCRARNRR